MLGEELRDAGCVRAVPVHAYAEGLDAAQDEPGVERAGHRAHRVVVEREVLGECVVRGEQGAADDVRVPAEVLRRRMHDDVRTEGQRLLQVRRRERVVDDQARVRARARAPRAPRCRRSPAVDSSASRTRSPSSSGRNAARTASRSLSGTGRELDAPVGQHARDQAVRPAVGVVGQDQVVARTADRPQQGVLRGHAAGERQAARACSRAASASSSARRVGLPERLYSQPPRVPPTPSCLYVEVW